MATASPKLTTKKQAETKPTTASRVTVTRKQGIIYSTYNDINIQIYYTNYYDEFMEYLICI